MACPLFFAFYGKIFSGIFQPLIYFLSICAHPLVTVLLWGVYFFILGRYQSKSIYIAKYGYEFNDYVKLGVAL